MSEVSPVHPYFVFSNDGDWRLFELDAFKHFRQYGAAGNGCLTGISKAPVFPGAFDPLKNADGTPHPTFTRFDHTPATAIRDAELTAEGLKEYKKAVERFPGEVERYEKGGNNQLTAFFNNSLSTDIQMYLASNKDWVEASDALVADNLTKWNILKRIYSQGNAKSKNRKFREFLSLSLSQGSDSYAVYAEKVHNGAKTMAYNFGSSTDPDKIHVDDLKLMVFLTGLHPVDFKFFLDKWYVDNPTGTKIAVDEVMEQVSIYSREHVAEPSASQYAVSMVANSPIVKCNGCGVPIPYVLSERGNPHSKCPPCYRKFLSELRSAKTTKAPPAVKPGPVVQKQSQADKTAARANVAASPSVTTIPIGLSMHVYEGDSESEED